MTAKISIQVGDTVYLPGQTVSGLSDTDIKWMMEKGYLEAVKKPKTKADKKAEVVEDVAASEITETENEPETNNDI